MFYLIKGWSNFLYGFLKPFGERISQTPPTHSQILSTSRQKPVHLESQLGWQGGGGVNHIDNKYLGT